MKEFYKKNKTDIDKTAVFLVFCIVMYVFFKFIAAYVAPFIFGYILCIILFPFVRVLEIRLKLSRGIASVLTITLLLLLLCSVGAGIISKIVAEGMELAKSTPEYIKIFLEDMSNLKIIAERYLEILPYAIRDIIDSLQERTVAVITSMLGAGVKTGSVGIVKKVPNIFMIVVLGFISSFFMLKDKEEIENFMLRQFPKAFSERLYIVKTGLIGALCGYFKAQFIMACIIGSICFVGLSILDSPYSLFLAFIIAFIDALPVFGSGAIYWPWIAYLIISGDYGRAIGLGIIYIIILVTRQILEPRVLGDQIGIHPLVTLISIYAGLKFFGLFGFIIGPMLVIVLKAMQDSDLLPRWK